MDLGYDNKIVAAKTWAALFALREWAIKAEKDLLQEQIKVPEPSWNEILTTLAQTEKFKEQLNAWVPREINVGVDIPRDGSIEDYVQGTPERKLVEVLSYWKVGNYGDMARNIAMHFREESSNKTASQLREIYKGRKLEKFELLRVEDEAAAITTIRVRVWENEDNKDVNHVVVARMINEDEKGESAIHGAAGSEWHLIWYGLNHYIRDENVEYE